MDRKALHVLRADSGVYRGWTVPLEYDPLISKLITWGRDRGEAIERMLRALQEYSIVGIKTTIPFFRRSIGGRLWSVRRGGSRRPRVGPAFLC